MHSSYGRGPPSPSGDGGPRPYGQARRASPQKDRALPRISLTSPPCRLRARNWSRRSAHPAWGRRGLTPSALLGLSPLPGSPLAPMELTARIADHGRASCMLSRFWSSVTRTGLACPRALPPVGALRTSSGAFTGEIRRLRHFGRFERLVGRKPTRAHRSEGRARPAQYSSAVMPSRTTSWYVPAKNSCWRRRPSSTKPSLR